MPALNVPEGMQPPEANARAVQEGKHRDKEVTCRKGGLFRLLGFDCLTCIAFHLPECSLWLLLQAGKRLGERLRPIRDGYLCAPSTKFDEVMGVKMRAAGFFKMGQHWLHPKGIEVSTAGKVHVSAYGVPPDLTEAFVASACADTFAAVLVIWVQTSRESRSLNPGVKASQNSSQRATRTKRMRGQVRTRGQGQGEQGRQRQQQ